MLDGGSLPAPSHGTVDSPPMPSFPWCPARELSVEEQGRLARDTDVVSTFKRDKLEREAQRNWDLFYKRNSTKFFKDRHWTTHEFKELCDKKVSFIFLE